MTNVNFELERIRRTGIVVPDVNLLRENNWSYGEENILYQMQSADIDICHTT